MPAGLKGINAKSSRKKRSGEFILQGQAASPGVVVGKAFVIPHGLPAIPDRKLGSGEVEAEIERFQTALQTTRAQLVDLQEKLKKKLTDQTTRIFDAHLMMLEDVMAVEQTIQLIRSKRMGAERAFSETIENIIRVMSSHTQDQYLRERLEDIRDVERRVLENLLGICDITGIKLNERVVLVAHELTPSQTAQLERCFVLALRH